MLAAFELLGKVVLVVEVEADKEDEICDGRKDWFWIGRFEQGPM